MAIHLQDNGGSHNQHQLPFDGNINWNTVMEKIACTGYQGATTLETNELGLFSFRYLSVFWNWLMKGQIDLITCEDNGGDIRMKIDRILGIIIYLMNHDNVSASYLAERFHVSVRTIQRDMISISAIGVPIYSESGKNGGYSILPTYKIKKQRAQK